jgi:hypothetical protein
MTSPSPTETPSAATPVLTAEAAHARLVLDVAARGPDATRTIVPSLMRSLVHQGYRTSVTWYLAPSPTDDLHEVIFSVRSEGSDDPDGRRWRHRREIAAVLEEAERLAQQAGRVEVWSGNGHGLRRLVIVGGAGKLPTFLAPDLPYYAGEQSLASAAVAAWKRAGPDTFGQVTTPAETVAGNEGSSAGPSPASPPNLHPAPGEPDTNPAPAYGSPVASAPALASAPSGADAEALAAALQEALGQVRVEVDLGAVEELVADSLRSALAELPGTALNPEPERLAANGHPVSNPTSNQPASDAPSPTPTTDLEISAPYGIPAIHAERPLGGSQTPAGPANLVKEELERLVGTAVASAVDSSLNNRIPDLVEMLATSVADRLPAAAGEPRGMPPELDRLVARSVASTLEADLATRLPHLVDRLLARVARSAQGPTGVAEPDPADVARRVAASVLNPSEIAETLLFRMRPLLDEHNERIVHRETTEAERDRRSLEQTRQSLNRLAERLERRLDRLEGEVRRQGQDRAQPYRTRPEPVRPTPTGTDPDATATSAALRVLGPDGNP